MVANGVQAEPETPADLTTWSLEVTGPCAEVPGFTERLRAAIPSEALRVPAEAEMRVQVRTEAVGQQQSSAQVNVYDSILQAPAGNRAIVSEEPGCGALEKQLLLVVGILVEAGRGAPPPAPHEPAEPDPAPEPPPPQAPAPPSPPPPPPAVPLHLERAPRVRVGPPRTHVLGVVGTLGWGLMPGSYGGAELRWSTSAHEHLAIRVAGAFAGPARSDSAQTSGTAEFFHGYASLSGCPTWRLGPLRLGACAVLGVGATRVRSQDFGSNLTQRVPLVVLGAEGFVAMRLAGALEVVLGMQALGAPYRPRFTAFLDDGRQPVMFQPAAVSVRGHGGLQMRFR